METKHADLIQAIRNKIAQSGLPEASGIDFTLTQDDRIILEGEVSGRHAKRLMGDLIEEIPEVHHVENKIKIHRISRFTDHSLQGF